MANNPGPDMVQPPKASQAPPRKYERHSCRLKMRCRPVRTAPGHEEKYVEGMIRNQSVGGLLLESPIYFAVDTRLQVAFNSPDGRQSFMGVVTVKWSRRGGDAWHLGCATNHMDRF